MLHCIGASFGKKNERKWNHFYVDTVWMFSTVCSEFCTQKPNKKSQLLSFLPELVKGKFTSTSGLVPHIVHVKLSMNTFFFRHGWTTFVVLAQPNPNDTSKDEPSHLDQEILLVILQNYVHRSELEQ